jgi:hypothetical protein
VSLGTLAPRGERNVLVMSLDGLLRATSNPFFPYMIEKIFPDREAHANGAVGR